MDEVVIVAAARTGVGKFGGALSKIAASDLGAHIIKGLVAKTGIDPAQISEVIMGQVLTAGCGQNPARQAVIKSGLPDMVPAFTVGKVCGSGLKATHLAAQAIRCGDASIIIAGGGNIGYRLAKAIERRVAFVPGMAFYAADPDPRTMRMSFVTVPEPKLREGVRILGEVIAAG